MLNDFKVIRLSPRVYLYDASRPRPSTPEGILALPQWRSFAFGDGSHPTTRLCAGAVDFLCRQKVQPAFLDVGTGTGVLARIAKFRGARFVMATDVDGEARRAAYSNFTLDADPVGISVVDASPESWGPRFDLVVANILEGPLRELSRSLARALAPGGLLLLSGFTRPQIPSLRVAFEGQGLDYESDSLLEEWALLVFRR